MSRPWHKSWACSLDNPKIQMLTGDQFKNWSNLLWIADRHDDEGALPDIKLIAFQLRVSPNDALVLLNEQMSLGLVEMNGIGYVIHDWKHWQGDGKTDAQRKRNQRDRERNVLRNDDVTGHVTSNGPVTNESRDARARSSSSSLSSLEEGDTRGGNPPAEVAKLAARTEARWPAQTADHFVGDLCETFDYRLASRILDQAFDKDPRKLPRAWIRKACQNETAAGWEPDRDAYANGKPEAAALPPPRELPPPPTEAEKEALIALWGIKT